MESNTDNKYPKPKKDYRLIDLSKKLSYILRHGAEKDGYSLDKDGYVPVSEILLRYKKYSIQDILTVVNTNDKKRFELQEKEP
jgi:RNA:NAD 2'-phosphotransferase (TPT1/KptA family)